ncbi:hypothetical protein JTE90_002436 [Oedothorax gibbosus]|uniref:Uncharacterized protein n=1 Tax=Oedothorax gibbosus TaxID=931172 RepID=A0AAV6TIA3_9ARAC|nr:hypothetical protein JTE90_002436 [Oedothorax gibbosus]
MKVQGQAEVGRIRDPVPRGGGAHRRPAAFTLVEVAEFERTRWDPKDGETMARDRTRPEETLVESVAVSDVQIDRQIWV